ncbi:acetyltransferase (GNAT) family protein [Phyllobacterium bourgognense]|uniref:Acetyltransferase (GNAT) family protein n=1 Tax=Phyllobacterium bourgognense TaxID=314236 RepID=A0A368YS28_9HYPH|nr:acetyltransferase (GNAT) family protein [Phyllobacterium bourgognense]
MLVRVATVSDTERACIVLRRSILELCIADHEGDQSALAQWLANKTVENVHAWIESADQKVLVAERAGEILGVGSASAKGEILLNYVSPDARFQGVSLELMQYLEVYVGAQGNKKSFLSSTQTAHRFYLAHGYEDSGDPELWAGMSAQPMVKWLK